MVASQYPGRCICINTVTGNQCTYLLKVRIVYPEVNSISTEAIHSKGEVMVLYRCQNTYLLKVRIVYPEVNSISTEAIHSI